MDPYFILNDLRPSLKAFRATRITIKKTYIFNLKEVLMSRQRAVLKRLLLEALTIKIEFLLQKATFNRQIKPIPKNYLR